MILCVCYWWQSFQIQKSRTEHPSEAEWVAGAASTFLDGTINSVYEKKTKEKVGPSVCDLKLKGTAQTPPASAPLIGLRKQNGGLGTSIQLSCWP